MGILGLIYGLEHFGTILGFGICSNMLTRIQAYLGYGCGLIYS